MPYTKPGVEITQTYKTQSPVLLSPELEVAIMGTPIGWVDPSPDGTGDKDKILTIVTAGTGTDFDLTAIFNKTAIEDSIVIDLIRISNGEKIHLYDAATTSHFTVVTNVVTIPDVPATLTSAGVDNTLADGDKFVVLFGFTYLKTEGYGYQTFDNFSDLETTLGTAKTWNNLGFGAKLAMQNAGSIINTYGYVNTSTPDVEVDNLEMHEVYSIASMDNTSTTYFTAIGTHCENMSLPASKKERICFGNIDNIASTVKGALKTDRATNALAISTASNSIGSKRAFATHPSMGYVTESRHVSTIRELWNSDRYKDYNVSMTVLSTFAQAKLISETEGKVSTYKAGTLISDTIWDDLVANGWGDTSEVTVEIPVPGYYFAAAAAGRAISISPQLPKTNLNISGIDYTYGSADMFSEADLNSMATGGTYIFTQDSPKAAIYCRHQLSTDVTTIEKQELSITEQIDYAAKYIRNTLKAYPGKFNITPELFSLVNSVLIGVGNDLVRYKEILASITVNSVYQDPISPDTLRADVVLGIKYPGNHFKINLVI